MIIRMKKEVELQEGIVFELFSKEEIFPTLRRSVTKGEIFAEVALRLAIAEFCPLRLFDTQIKRTNECSLPAYH